MKVLCDCRSPTHISLAMCREPPGDDNATEPYQLIVAYPSFNRNDHLAYTVAMALLPSRKDSLAVAALCLENKGKHRKSRTTSYMIMSCTHKLCSRSASPGNL